MVEAMSAASADPGGSAGAPTSPAAETLDNSPVEAVAGALAAVELEPITYLSYSDESQMPLIMRLIQKDLSEPYSIYTYRYFIHNWPNLCFLAMVGQTCVGAIVCKLDLHKKVGLVMFLVLLLVLLVLVVVVVVEVLEVVVLVEDLHWR